MGICLGLLAKIVVSATLGIISFNKHKPNLSSTGKWEARLFILVLELSSAATDIFIAYIL